MSNIRLLSPDLINKIAAGEVVERPASVVKELIENSIDAGATEIKLKIEKGGINLIEVSDNGSGMDEDNAKLAFVQHATSKISQLKDLNNITSLGFRGEALASIESVADTTIITKTKSKNAVEVTKIGEKIKSKPASSAKTGTTVIVGSIFSKIPARRKFLKSESTEYRKVLDTFIKSALSNPSINFSLIHNGKLVHDLLSVETLERRIVEIYPELDNNLFEVFFSDTEIKIDGYIGHPRTNRKDRNRQYIIVNGRPINHNLISQAVKSAYGTNLMTREQPVFFLNLTFPSQQLDVNVHPRKDEIRFTNEQFVFKIVFKSVRKALENNLREELKSTTFSTEERYPGNKNFSGSKTQTFGYQPVKSESLKMKPKEGIDFTQSLLDDSNFEKPLFSEIYQVFKTYIITESGGDLLVIDQHAADERINFEQISNKFKKQNKLVAQNLLVSAKISLSRPDIERAKELQSVLARFGFEYNVINDDVIEISSAPELINGDSIENIFLEILSEFGAGETESKEESKFLKKIISSLACHSSIRAGQELSTFQANELVKNLLNCNNPYSCPHGRPIIWKLSKNDLERQFKRKL